CLARGSVVIHRPPTPSPVSGTKLLRIRGRCQSNCGRNAHLLHETGIDERWRCVLPRGGGRMAISERGAPAPVRRLPSALIDQIGAGGVVERPASVVKELIENALDAEATRLRVELRDGGRALVAVTDDGTGMSPEDARLALERHATSKLSRLEDLARIASYRLRGGALPPLPAAAARRPG